MMYKQKTPNLFAFQGWPSLLISTFTTMQAHCLVSSFPTCCRGVENWPWRYHPRDSHLDIKQVSWYSSLWNNDIVDTPNDPIIHATIENTQVFKLHQPVQSYGWDQLSEVPYITTSGAGHRHVGKKGDPGNHELAVKQSVYNLKAYLEKKEGKDTVFLYTPDLALVRTHVMSLDSPKVKNVWGKAFLNIILEAMSAAPLIEAHSKVAFDLPVFCLWKAVFRLWVASTRIWFYWWQHLWKVIFTFLAFAGMQGAIICQKGQKRWQTLEKRSANFFFFLHFCFDLDESVSQSILNLN